MLKKSYYNVPINQGENILLYNTITGGFGEITDKYTSIYNSSDIFDLELESDVEKIAFIETMRDNGFLVDSNLNEVNVRNLKSKLMRFTNNSFGLTIAPTLNCNMNCPYCYEKKDDFIMDEAIQDALMKFISETYKANRFNHLDISWYGGEPTLAMDVIKNLTYKMLEFCKENAIEYSSAMVTNGLLISKELSMELCELKISNIQITVDGTESTHNMRRIPKYEVNSFTKIIENIENIRGNISISIRVNVDTTNVDECKKLIDFFVDKKFYRDGISFYFAPVSSEIGECNYDNTCFSKQEFGEIESGLIEYISRYEDKINLSILKPPVLSGTMCGFTSPNAYVCGPHGELYKCWNEIGQKEKTVGNIHKGIILNSENIKWLQYELEEPCKKCKMVNLCNGGCPYEKMNSIDSSCSFKTISLEPLLLAHYKSFLRNYQSELRSE